MSTSNYGFMVLLNIGLLGVAGLVSIGFLIKTLSSLQFQKAESGATPPLMAMADDGPRKENAGVGLFFVWILTYGIVGAQMGWILRPFIGAPGVPFELFRPRDGSFLQGVYNAVHQMI